MRQTWARIFWNELLRDIALAVAVALLAVTLTSCYVAPYPYRAVAYVGPPGVVVRAHPCWRCW
ncbi:MAG TPA: hypothetical protein VMQ73_12000 [Methylomirabilota bacterium]|nr:hypothetical protein [Methylomirabilota bacterium]